MSIPIIINGACGKMGAEIGVLVLEDAGLRLSAVVERQGHPRIGEDYGTCIGKASCGLKVTDSWDAVTVENPVVLDFSSEQSTGLLLELALKRKMQLVIGTTGCTEKTLNRAKKVAEEMPVLVSPNMSLGVNLLFSLVELVSLRLKDDFDIEIIEAHHRFKKDAPSGTARHLGEIVSRVYGLPYGQVIRNGRSGTAASDRLRKEVGMHAVRGGDIVGDHIVLFAGMGERIELRHMAHNRTNLARGAVAAVKWLAGRGPGYYTMKDVLGL